MILKAAFLSLALLTFLSPISHAADESKNTKSSAAGTESRSAQNWLPADHAPGEGNIPAPINKIFSALNGRVRLLICRYQDNKLVSSSAFSDGILEAEGATWKNSVTADEKNGVASMDVTFKLEKGIADSAGVAVAFDFLKWNADNYVFAPAVLYDGNKFKILPVPYPPYIYDPKDRPLDMPITVTNILHLNKDRSPGLVEMMTFNLATPMMGFYDRTGKRGFLVLTDPKTSWGVSGMMVQENPARKMLTMVVSAPGVRVEKYFTSGGRAPSGDKGANFKAGDEVNLRFKIYEFAADGIPAFMTKVFDVRKSLSGPTTYRDLIPYSAAFEMISKNQEQNKYFEDGKYGYYVSRITDSPFHSQIGWAGNPIFSHPPAIGGSPEQLRRVGKTWDMMTEAQGKSGLFYAMFYRGKIYGDTFKEWETRPTIAMTRRTGDVLFFGIQQLEVLKAQGAGGMIKPEWEQMLRRSADALVTLYERYGQFGQHADADTGEMEINGSTAGAVGICGLTLAAEYFKNPKYLKIAEEAGKMYYDRDLTRGYAGGGAGEILQSPDGETPWDLAEGYMALYEATGQDIWLQRARDAINLLATWTLSYDYEFPPNSDLGRVGAKSTGSIFASSANNHSAPGFYVLSGDFLLRYYRATGDPRYAELYKDIVHNVTQYVNTEKNPIQPGCGEGFVSERVQVSDWEGPQFGQVHHNDSNYPWECLVQLASQQNPGIYLNTTTGAMLVLDHVKTEIVSRDAQGTKLKLTNNSLYPAKVSIFAETSKEAKKPLGYTAFLKWPKVEVGVGETEYVLVKPDGTIKPADS